MIALENDTLLFRFPEVHAAAVLRVDFQRTLRIPDDDRNYPLPPGLGRFPLHHVDDFASGVPEAWLRHGGVMLPMYQSEALWLNFESSHQYPFAVKVATGKINAVTGHDWDDGLHRNPQDYLAIPDQPGLPWFEYYSEQPALGGSQKLGGLESVAQKAKSKGEPTLPENEPVTPEKIVKLRAGLQKGQVREGAF